MTSRALSRVRAWLGARGWRLVRSRRYGMRFALAYAEFEPECTIYVQSGLAPRTQLYMALHECGHVLIGHHRKTPKPIDVLAEEIEAWTRARRLATRLGIRVNPRAWRSLRNRCLVSYARAV